MADSYISKIKLANGTTVLLKDAKGRADMETLLGEHALLALGDAAWKAVAAGITNGDAGLATAEQVKAYVDSAVKAIPEFDVVIVADGEELPVASADTFHKIYLKKASTTGIAQNIYKEYITVKNGDTYSWELIGDTAIDVSGKVDKTTTIAGIALDKNISVEQLQSALQLGSMAYAATASGSDTIETIDSITMKPVTVAGNATVTHTPTAAGLTKGDFTPSGEILIDGKKVGEEGFTQVIKGGSINVTLKDAKTTTEANVTRDDYKPAGTVSLEKNNAGSFQVSGTNSASAVSFEGGSTVSVLGSVKTEQVLPSFTDGKIGTFVAPSIASDFVTAGSKATYSHSGFNGGSLAKGDAVSAASDGILATVGEGADSETLIFTSATKNDVMSHNATFTPATYGTDTFDGGTPTVIDTSKFNAGSWTPGVFNAGTAIAFNNATVIDNIGTGTAAAQTFVGDKFAPAFSGTTEAGLKVSKVEYVKQAVDAKTFTPETAALSFSGTKANQILVTGVTYDKADATAAFSETVTPETKTLTRTAKTVEITVSPDPKA